MINRVVLNETSYFGRGSREKLKEELNSRTLKRAFVVTDHDLVFKDPFQFVLTELNKSNVSYYVFDKVIQNSTITIVKEGISLAKEFMPDCIVAVGGGSAIDTAKAIGIVLTNPEFSDIKSLEGFTKTKKEALPIFALPTTSGSSSEATINYVITDEARVKRMVCIDTHDIPKVAIIDPDLMDDMSKEIAASTGMAALIHAIEGYITKDGWLIPDMFLINAMSILYRNLEKAVNEKDKKAIEKVAYAQYVAGMGFSNAGLGIAHSMSHSLEAYFEIPHGISSAVLAPYVLKFNGNRYSELYRNMAKSFGIGTENLSDLQVIDTIVNCVRALSIKLGLPQKLIDIGVPEEILPTLAKQTINDPCIENNLKKVTVEDILAIYKEAYK